MKNLYKILFLTAIIGLSTYSAKAVNITATGIISSNTSWNADTVKVTGNVTVNNGVTLTISAGTYVQFQGHFKLDIKGRLLAIGTATNKITFTALNTSSGWSGIKFHQTPLSNDTSIIEYCILTYSKLNVGGTYDKQGGAIFCYQFSKLIIRNNIISNNYVSYYGGAISCWYYSSPKIINNVISNNTASSLGGGIFIYNGSSPDIINNTIVNNQGSQGGGVIAYNSSCHPKIINCIVWGNTASSYPQIGKSTYPIIQNCNVQGGYAGIGNIDTLPAFVSPSAGVGYTYNGLTADWGIQSTSPCRNAGIYPAGYGVSMLDVNGNFRYDEGTIDIGALEYIVSEQACGTISSNTTWSGDVLITCDVLVANGITLTIEPGTKVNFLGKYHLDIDGRLLAVGTQDSLIEFTCHNPNEGWYGIDFVSTSTSNDTSKIEYSVIKHGKANGSIDQDKYGGGIYIYGFSKLIIRSNIISNNWSNYYGGGICCRNSSAKIINNVIVNNTADDTYGGGIAVYGSSSSYTPWIINNTISKNKSISSGGGIFRDNTATPLIKNNIIWNNADNAGNKNLIEQVYPTTGLNITYSDVKGAYAGTGNINSIPKFKNASSGAGSTFIGYNKDWSLQETSPCIDAGTPSAAGLQLPPVDLLGKTRVYSTSVDIGAYEDKSSLTACGYITSNTTWDANTVNVSCDVIVNNGVKLTILPGVKVKFAANYKLEIKGSLYAVGTETDTIRFTSDVPSTGWEGIIINNPNEYSNDSTIIHNCRIEYLNYSTSYGGAVDVYYADEVRISNCLIKNNTNSSGRGGGIGLYRTRALVKNNLIKNNNARYGAGISCYYSYDDEIKNNIIENNIAYYQGGGIYLRYSTNTVSNNFISNNKTTILTSSYSYGGGGIYYEGYYVSTFKNNIIVNNTACNGGGINVYYDSKPQFFNNTIANNYCTYNGGGLMVGNNADPIFKNNIFYNDSAGNVGGGNEVYIYDVTSDPKFYNCLIEGGSTLFSGTGSQLNFNGVYSENIDNDPLFTNPSAGQGISYDGLTANWYIDSLSPCINKGTSDASGLGTITYDYAGNPRINKGRIDIGAYENQEDIYAECTISSNTIWEVDTLKVGCNVTVNNGVTLTISPGTYVEFQGHYKLDIQGRLLALGTSDEPIVFSVVDTTGFTDMTGTSGAWDGIDFNSTPNSNDTSKIVYCVIKYGKARETSNYTGFGGGLFIYNYSKVVIANSIISNNRAYYKGGGIYIESSNPVIKNSIICNNSAEGQSYPYGGGIYLDDAYPKIYNNTIAYNYCSRYGGGIYCYNSSPVFKNNIMNKNQGYYSQYSYSYREEIRLSTGSNPSFYNNNIMGGKNKIAGYQYITTYQDNIDTDTLSLFINAPDSMGAKYDGLSANWDLDQNSPCINAGTPNLAGINPGGEDYVGNNRIVGDTIDIGHFEIQLSRRFITTQPIAQTACVGASASFSVVIGVSSNYQWQKDGTNINGETGTTLTLSNVTLADTGNYSCVFSNAYGSVVSDVVSLTVQTTPVISLNPISTSRCLNDSVTFKVEAIGTQPITYQWQNTSGNLQGSAPMAFYTLGSTSSTNSGYSYPAPYGNYYWGARHQFIIRASELSAAGISAGDIQSLAFDVTNANNCPPLVNFTIKIALTTDTAVNSTWKTGLTEVYTNSSYQPTVGWNTHAFQSAVNWDGTSNLIIETCFNNSSWLSSGNASISFHTTSFYSTHERHSDNATVCTSTGGGLYAKRPVVKILAGSGVSSYYINSITQNDATTYKCEASNVCGSQLSTGAVLSIKTPPSVSSLPGTYTLCETNPIPLSVTATGDPTPTYQWYKDSTIMTGYTNIQLNISAAAASDQGDYYCKATNECGDDSTNISSVIVDEEPDITSQSSSSSVCENQSLTLSATASGAQPLTYQWYKNSISIAGATNNTYTISSVSTTDAATYVCRATNSCGYDESNGIVITVKTAPTLSSQTSSTSVCQGSSTSFTVTAGGTTPITYQWYNSIGAIGSATNYSYAASTAENYYCKATNACGNVTSNTMALSVNTAPTITASPTSTSQCEGSGASFSVTSTGTSPITYQWYKSSSAITGATNNSYLISPVTTADAASYYCKATNSCGNQNSSTATLTVTVAPSITAQSSSATVCSGSSNTFSITATGSGTPTYQWYNSSGAIGSATNNSYSANSADNYYCKVTNACGNATSNTMSLSVNSSPTITSQPSSISQCVGLGASFNVNASGTSPITYQWYNGSGAISGATNNSYLISPVASADVGSYYCKATNSCGNTQSNAAILTVTNAPAITAQSSSASVCSGSSSLFSITASGTPTPTYQWYNSSGAISSATNNTYSASVAGNYYCIATNTCGNATSNTMILTVNTTPTITTQPSNSTKCEGQSAQFSIAASGTSPITYQWYDGSGAISGATNNSYLISPVASADVGSYYCIATNTCGNAQSTSASLTVNVSPVISAQTSSVDVCSGSSTIFSVTASGTPTPAYQWYNASGAISSATNNTYSASSMGDYYCIATNSCGNVTSNTMVLTVNTAPSITTQPANSTKCEGQSAQFNVTAGGTAPLTYQWYDINSPISGETGSSFLISPVTSSDAGNYYCKVTNSCGNQNSNTATLTVKSTVSITSQSGDSTKCSGNDMNFSVTATGTAPITYQWYNNSGSIFGATASSYTKSNVISSDAGGYYCIATNSCGFASSTTKTLSVISLPAITSQSGNDTACIGQSATFSITASGTQPLSYQWYKATTAISNANNNTFTISSVSATDAGIYHCEVTNSCGSVSSTSAVLLVNIPVSIVSQTGDSIKCAGDDMQFGITATGTAPITYQWYNNSGSIFGATANTYTKFSVVSADAGSYYCVATNLCGTAQSSNKVLTVNTAPAISTQTANNTLCQGQGMTFNVNASGTSPLTYQWYKGSTAITAANASTYSISSVIPSDAGAYHCVVSNSCGTVSGNNITLAVNALPAITNQTSSTTKCTGQSMTFSVTTTGASPLTYQWFINNDSLKFASNSTYNISSLDTSDIGIYYCVVTNSCGTVQSNNISLDVNVAPAITSQSGSDIKCVGQSMTFNVTATGTDPKTYQWYDNSGLITGATNNIYILTSVDTSDAGTYYCIVTNSCGTAQSTSKVLTVESPALITSQSSGAIKCEGQNMVFTVTASGTSPIFYQWYDNSGLIIGATNSSYTINSVMSANSGSYYCIATNSCGSDASNIAILTVNTAPAVTQQSQNTTVCEGQNVVFTNTVSGTQPITYQWYDNSGSISGSTNSIFVIPSVDTADAGYYYCKSTNICGDDSTSNIILTVNSPILITYQSGDSSRCVGESMTFSVQSNGTLPITYQWYDANGSITGATNNSYVINSVTLADAGYYYCVLTNTCGTAQSIYKTLTVHALPVVNLGNDTTFCDGGSVILSPGFGYTTLWNVGSFNPQLSVTSTGAYWCSVIDQYGCQATSDTINVNVSLPFANEELCIVGVDSASQKNIIVWEKTPNVGVVSYNIYKESTVTGVFNLIANKDVDSLSTFIDLASNPVAKRERYAIASIDTCGNESGLSSVHATIHLAVSPYQGGGWTLNWLSYNGFTPATYYIWRADVNYNWTLIDSMAASSTQYNDPTAPDSCFYSLEILKPGPPCSPSTSKANTNYNSSRSNIANTFLQALIANFNANPISGNVPLTVQFYDESLGGPTIWSWNFGDGKAGSTQNPVHVYDSLGTFDVTLTASSANGSSSSTKFGYINVTNVGVSEFVLNSSISVYPNPYNDRTNIAYELYNEANVKVEVYNMIGERINVLVDKKQMTGVYKYQFSAQDLGHSTGLYFLRIQINDRVFTKKLIEVK
ncbi:immunoglobulin domain-containing protein [Bacteroidota bacterium]